ncbi:MAG: glycosyltransferase family 2 protein [Chlorobi bacterium]|nr:glycosyltransferase family 2 protein [Chlorobiota bacterium]MCI0715280.1 glycosyltransferase family 2 protein [Chlorobiota bacterium]
MDKGLISIVIPNYNGIEHLQTCFESIYRQDYRNYKIIMLDNGSADDSVNFTKKNYPEVELIIFNYNTGFAKAVNKGIKLALKKYNPSYILLLNNDVELEKNFLSTAIDTFENVLKVDIIAAKMMNFYSRDTIDDTGNFITKKGGTPYPRGNTQKDTGQYDKPEFIFGACAGAAFYKKGVFEKAGFFDEDFFAYLEDIDFSFRAQLYGFKCYYQPKAICYHKRGGSSISTYRFQVKMNERNVVWLRIKNYPILLYILYQPLFVISRTIKFALLLKNHGFKILGAALWGYILGLLKIFQQIPKRMKIQKNRIVSSNYILSLFR